MSFLRETLFVWASVGWFVCFLLFACFVCLWFLLFVCLFVCGFYYLFACFVCLFMCVLSDCHLFVCAFCVMWSFGALFCNHT